MTTNCTDVPSVYSFLVVPVVPVIVSVGILFLPLLVVPVVPVIVSVGIRYEDYGVRDVEGNLTL